LGPSKSGELNVRIYGVKKWPLRSAGSCVIATRKANSGARERSGGYHHVETLRMEPGGGKKKGNGGRKKFHPY